jgi:hypothetical protein
MLKRTFAIVFLLQFISCDIVQHKLKIINNSDDVKYCTIRLYSALNNNLSEDLQEVQPGSYYCPTLVSGRAEGVWEYTINKYSDDSTLYIYFFESNNPDDSIIQKHKYKRFDLKVKELDSLKWIVNYK